MKKRLFSLLLVSALVFTLSGCGEKSLLRESDPVTLNFWLKSRRNYHYRKVRV